VNRFHRVAVFVMVPLLSGCGGGHHGPTAPPPPVNSRLVVRSHPEAATVAFGAAGPRDFTPVAMDTLSGSYVVHLSLLGYADTTVTAVVTASPETVTATLRPLPGTPTGSTSWGIHLLSGTAIECMSLGLDGRVYVLLGNPGAAPGGNGVIGYSQTGVQLSEIGYLSADEGYCAVAVNAAGDAFLAPRFGGYVSELNPAGTLIGSYGASGTISTFHDLSGMFLDPAGDSLYVVGKAGLVSILRPSDGVLLDDFGADDTARGAALNTGPSARDAAGNFYFAPAPGTAIVRTDRSGHTVASWPMPGPVVALTGAPDGTLYAAAVAPTASLQFFPSEKAPGRILHLSGSGTVLGQWGTEHILAVGIGVTANGDVFVADYYGGLVAGNPQGAVYRWSNQ